MGFFDNIATPVEDIPAGYGLPNNTYEVVLSDISEREQSYDDGHTENKLLIEFTVTEGELEGMKHTVWLTQPDEDNPKTDKNGKLLWKTQASIGKNWLLNIGVPENELGNFTAEEGKDALVGNTGTLKLTAQKSNPEYQNASFKLDEEQLESGVSDRTLDADGNTEVNLGKFV